MIFSLFRRHPRADTISTLYGMIVAQARLPVFYRDYAVADTVNGRFDLIVLHLALLLDRLASDPDSQSLGQGIFDRFCEDMDDNLREMGIGDLKVPKEMREEVVKTATANAKAAGRTMTTKDLTDAAKTLVPTVPKAVKKKDDAVVQTGKGQDAAASTDEKTQATEPVVPPTQLPAELPAKPSSATDQLYELWLKATAVEREAFLKLINAEIVEPSLPLFEDNN